MTVTLAVTLALALALALTLALTLALAVTLAVTLALTLHQVHLGRDPRGATQVGLAHLDRHRAGVDHPGQRSARGP